MKQFPVVVNHDDNKIIGWFHINEEYLPIYPCELGLAGRYSKPDMSDFELTHISLVANPVTMFNTRVV